MLLYAASIISAASVRSKCLKLRRKYDTMQAAEDALAVEYDADLSTSSLNVSSNILDHLPLMQESQLAELCLSAFKQMSEDQRVDVTPTLIGQQAPDYLGQLIKSLFQIVLDSHRETATKLLDKLLEMLLLEERLAVTQCMKDPVKTQVLFCSKFFCK